MKKALLIMSISFLVAQQAYAILLIDPKGTKVWQSANLGSFAQLNYRSDVSGNRQQIIHNPLLDDGLFDTRDYSTPAYANTINHLRLQTDRVSAFIILGGPEALMRDGNNEIYRLLTAKKNYRPLINIPEPSSLGLMVLGAMGMFIIRRRNRED